MATVSNDVGFCKDSRLLSISVGEIEKKMCLKKKKHNENHQVKMPPSFKFFFFLKKRYIAVFLS